MVKVGPENKIMQARLKKARKQAGLTQMDVKHRLGISNQSLSAYENGVNGVELEVLQQLADCYGVTVDWLLGKTDRIGENYTVEEKKLVDRINFSDEDLIDVPMQYFGRELTEEDKKRVLSVVRALLDSSR
ncbi:helix-turn-helix domain-containing protein [Cohnella sp. REN36]|uniref:helix-turn-helix domain-containing protein n=1 Tax=Cohnella sp. REN36 TaxID=2887347 RepID=UPI001D145EE1|nr:helix-turn-helix domain-containing protein [Cohnella sp. REN36]MCC3377162.1 helix-turn-helix domain-containing protein [Cohnella sp. REN36]